MAIQAVLTGDIVNSTKLAVAAEKTLIKILRQVLQPTLFEFYRGDSFQAYLPEAKNALQVALLCRTAAMALVQESQAAAADVRISIGIASTPAPVAKPGLAKGEAFILSGRAFDTLEKTNSRLAIVAVDPLAGQGLEVIADYLDAVFKEMTGKQAMIIFELLKGNSQQTVATRLKKSKSTISQHVAAARWPEIEKLLQQYQTIINQIA